MFSLRTLASVALALSFAAALAAGGVAAQPDAQNETVENESAVEAPDVEQAVDSEIGITGWRYSGDSFVIDLWHSGERPKSVRFAEPIQQSEGSGEWRISDRRILPGETTVTIPIPRRSGEAAVGISTSDGIEEQRGAFLSTGQVDQNPFSAFGGTLGLFVGVGLASGLALLAAYVTIRRESDGVEVAT